MLEVASSSHMSNSINKMTPNSKKTGGSNATRAMVNNLNEPDESSSLADCSSEEGLEMSIAAGEAKESGQLLMKSPQSQTPSEDQAEAEDY